MKCNDCGMAPDVLRAACCICRVYCGVGWLVRVGMEMRIAGGAGAYI